MDNPLIPTVKYATLITEGDGVETAWEFNFAGGYISPEHVKAFTENVATGELVIRPLTLIGPNTAQITPAVADGLRLIIYRDTPKTEPLVDYSTGSILNESSLDKSNKQAVFIAAELADRVIADYDFSNALLYAVTTAATALAVATGIDAKAQLALDTSEIAEANSESALSTATSAAAALAAHTATIIGGQGAYSVGWTSSFPSMPAHTVGYKLQNTYHLDDAFPEGTNFLTTDAKAVANSYISKVAAAGGGIINMGAHAYFMQGVTIKHGVYLRGHPEVTTIVCSNTTEPGFLMESFCGLSGVRAFYPNQTTTGDPVPHAPFITSAATGPVGATAYVTVSDIDLNNAYDGIVFGTETIGAGPFWIRNVVGWPMNRGIVLDNTTDCPYLHSIHLNPNANHTSDYTQARIYESAVAYEFGRVDGLDASSIFCFGYATALRLRSGAPSGSANMVRISQFGFDICRSPLDIGFHQDGVFLSNGFCTTGGSNYRGVIGGICLIGGGQTSPQGKVTISSVSFRHFHADVLAVTSNCDLNMVTFTDYNEVGGSYSAVRVATDGVALNVTGGSIAGYGRSGTSGITSDGFINNDLRVQGVEFVGITANDIRLFGGGSLYVASNKDSAGSMWNSVPFDHSNSGRMSTYQAPSTFPGFDAAAFLVGTTWGHSLPAVGQPKGWIRTVATAVVSLGNL